VQILTIIKNIERTPHVVSGI